MPDAAAGDSAVETMADWARKFAGLLPAAPPGRPEVASGYVGLFLSNSWTNGVYYIDTTGRPDRKVMSLSGLADVQDAATWVAYNLPVGLVVTLVDDIPRESGILPANCGTVIDLVGTGTTETVDLGKVGMNDTVSGWYRRSVDLQQGGAVHYDDANSSGSRVFLFASDWQEHSIHSFTDWGIDDRATSAAWFLSKGQYVTLYEHPDGGGRSYHEIAGGSTSRTSRLGDAGFSDAASAFSWTGIRPVKEEIRDAPVTFERGGNVQTIRSTATCRNETSGPQEFEVSISLSAVRELSVEDVDTHGAGGSVELSASYTAASTIPIASVSTTYELSVSAHYDYTTSSSKAEATSQEESQTVTETVTAAPLTETVATLEVEVARVSETIGNVKVRRWYEVAVPGSTQEPDSKLWWRDESTTIRLGGGIRLDTRLRITEKHIAPSDPDAAYVSR